MRGNGFSLKTRPPWFGILVLVIAAGCEGTQPSVTVQLPLVADGSTLSAFTTDLGYEVTLARVRLAASGVWFTQGGEPHSSVLEDLQGLLVPPAHAHPGHYGGGEVTGERAGPFIVEWTPGSLQDLGDAILVTGDYHGANLPFRLADDHDDLAAGDILVGHSVHVEGISMRGGDVLEFEAVLDVPSGGEVIGMAMDLEVRDDTVATLAWRLLPLSNVGTTLVDGVDFKALDPDGDGTVRIEPGQEDHNRIQRAFLKHDFYEITTHPVTMRQVLTSLGPL